MRRGLGHSGGHYQRQLPKLKWFGARVAAINHYARLKSR
jgi:hypothetical protein